MISFEIFKLHSGNFFLNEGNREIGFLKMPHSLTLHFENINETNSYLISLFFLFFNWIIISTTKFCFYFYLCTFLVPTGISKKV